MVNIIRVDWDIKNEFAQEKIANYYFSYNVEVDQDAENRTLIITHKYKSYALSVPPEDIKQFAKNLERALEISIIHVPDSGLEWSNENAQTEVAPETSEEHAYNTTP